MQTVSKESCKKNINIKKPLEGNLFKLFIPRKRETTFGQHVLVILWVILFSQKHSAAKKSS
jgi:hypothetical protein